MRVERKPFIVAKGLEDSLCEKFRRYIHDMEYWVEVARLDGGGDSSKYQSAHLQLIVFTLCLGERVMNLRHGFEAGVRSWNPEMNESLAITEGNDYLAKIKAEGTPEVKS